MVIEKKEKQRKKRKGKEKTKERNIKMFLSSFLVFLKILESFENKSILNLFQQCVIR
jgi:hypothetical protein